MNETLRPVLTGRKALVVGIANDQSIAYGCAKAFRAFGAELAVTYLNEKAKKYVEPPCHFPWTPRDTGRIRDSRIRRIARQGTSEGSRPEPREHR